MPFESKNRSRRNILIAGVGATVAVLGVPLARRWLRDDKPPEPAAPTHGSESPVGASDKPTHASSGRFSQPLRQRADQGLFAEIALTRPLELVATAAEFPLFAGTPTTLWHYAGTHQGHEVANPLLRINQGDTLDVTLRNALPDPTTAHWHGLAVDEANDGSGLHPVAPGADRRYSFRVDNRAGLYWYHAHPHLRTGKQIQRGLAGLLLVEDAEEHALRKRLGLAWGERDLALMIADKQVDDKNSIIYKDNADDWIGNRVMVNWTPEPYLDVVPGLYRLRIVNGSNARMWRLAFVHQGHSLPFHLIGTDGGLLERPWRISDAFLAPAQRIDVLLDLSDVPVGEQVLLTSLDYMAMENEVETGPLRPHLMADHPGAVPMGAALDIMELRVGADTGTRRAFGSAAIPAQLSSLPATKTDECSVRRFRLGLDSDGSWRINDWNLHITGHEPVFSVRRGSREIWEISNAMASMPHPIHVHGFQFRMLSRSISPPDIRALAVAAGGLSPQDLGLLDTVVVWPGETVRIVLDFSQTFRGLQRYMLHCHNLEHEDMGMMITFAVDDQAKLPAGC